MPFPIRLIIRTDIIHLIPLFSEVCSTIHQEPGKIIKLILLQVDIFRVLCHRSRTASHKVRSRVSKEQKVVHAPFTGRLHKPLLTGLFRKVIATIGSQETLRTVPRVIHLLRFPVFIAARPDVHAPVRQSHAYRIAVFIKSPFEEQVRYPFLLLLRPILADERTAPGIRSTEVINLLIHRLRIHGIRFLLSPRRLHAASQGQRSE